MTSSTDIVLDVTQIRRWSTSLGAQVTSVSVDGALHDVFLSAEAVRKHAFGEVDRFLTAWVEER